MSGNDASLVGRLVVTTAHQTLGSFYILSVAALGPILITDYGFKESFLGVFPSMAYAVAMMSSASAAFVISRLGAMGTSNLAVLLGALGFLLLYIQAVWSFILGAVFMGLCYGPLNPVSSQVLSVKAPPRRRNLVLSVKQSGVPLGGAIAGLSLPWLAMEVGIEAVIMLGFLIGIAVIGFGLGVSVKVDRETVQFSGEVRDSGKSKMNRAAFFLAGASFFYSFIQLALSVFLGVIAYNGLELSPISAGMLLFAFHLAGMFGRPFWGWVADSIGEKVPVYSILGFLMATLVFILYVMFALHVTEVALLCFVAFMLGFCASGWNGVYFGELYRSVQGKGVASITGRALTFTFAGVVLGPTVFGIAIGYTGLVGGFVIVGLAGVMGGILAFLGVRAVSAGWGEYRLG